MGLTSHVAAPLQVALRLARAGRKGAEASLAGLQAALESGPPRIVCKPQPEAYTRALCIAGADARSTLFFDDSLRNIGAGKAAGLATVLVGRQERCEGADLALPSVHELPAAVPSLWPCGGPAAGPPEAGLEERASQQLPSVPA
ncbi:Haloacid dehalogenase-like hydrolase (HAD) superfamily protein [Klebsormidium nitens]|uniref:30S ribosomal protein S16, chloroplastic n=1 Tax=Klebsormidium nitens TaxID=105231 RepID=A0A1Y1ISG4_KLENI|nr:Haloacid dehalogenase-like hydrolase (HAD) superfamily protein [Klebsormidium nitens]|eukprot:GAQ92211.1 Haloacid dehalogenase-like hydrolase (HAD) superfamily protein [Klebsormidium nitens]